MSAAHEHAAVAVELALGAALDGPELAERARLLVSTVGDTAVAAGCRLIGHIKCLVRSDPAGMPASEAGGHLYVSLTSLRHGPVVQGALPAAPDNPRLALAAIVYGIDEAQLAALIESCLAQHFPGAKRL